MSALRSLPPVIGPIDTAALLRAAASLRDADAVGHAVSALERRYPGRHAYLTRSGTVALEMAIREAQRSSPQAGPACVALPAWCCPDVASAAIGAGARIALYDLDPSTLHPDADSLERALQVGAQAVVFVHYFGRVTDPAPYLEIVQRYGAALIEDAAQGAGAHRDGVPVGALTSWGVLSFGRGKGRHAGGGGAVLSDAPLSEVVEGVVPISVEFKIIARAIAVSMLARPSLFGLARALPLGIGETRYVSPASDKRISRVVAALVPHVLQREHFDADQRRARAHVWRQMLVDKSFALLSGSRPGEEDGALRFPVLADASMLKDVQRLGVAKGYPDTLDQYPEIRPHLVRGNTEFPGARALADRLHTLPNHRYVTERDRAQIVKAISL